MSPLTLAFDATPTLAPRNAAGRAGLALMKSLLSNEDEEVHLRVFVQSLFKGLGREHGFLETEAASIHKQFGRPKTLYKAWASGVGAEADRLVGKGADVFVALGPAAPPSRRPPVAAFSWTGEGIGDTAALERLDLAMAPSRWRERQLLDEAKLSAHRVAYVPWGFDESVFRRLDERMVHIGIQAYGLPAAAFLLARSGHGEEHRNNLILDVYEELLRRQPKRCPELVVVGWKGKPPEELKKRETLHRRVLVLPPVGEEDLAALFGGASAVLVTARESAHGLDVAEPMACGTPVVCPKGSAYDEFAGPGCLQPNSEEASDWADAVEAAAFDPEVHSDASDAAETRSRESWDCSKTREAFLQAVSGLAIG